MSFERAYDRPGPLIQSITIDYNIDGSGLKTVFKAYVRAEFAALKASIQAETPYVTGALLRDWDIKLRITNRTITVKLRNESEYSNYITSGSSIYSGTQFLERAMAEFELGVLTEVNNI